MKYQDYSVEDFVKDEFFVNWVKDKQTEADHYWKIWIRNNPEKLETVNAAIDIINSINYKNQYELSEKEYIEVFEEIVKGRTQDYQNDQPGKIFMLNKLVAAVLVPILIAALAFFYYQSSETKVSAKETTYLAKESPIGIKTTFKLEDGTRVKLNAGSSLRFPDKFSEDQRIVYLEGEAFFDVVKETSRPFLVVTNDVVTKVLGTSFNVKGNSVNQSVEVALVTGKVSVSDNEGNSIILQPTEMVTFANSNIEKKRFNHDLITGWTLNRLVFDKADSKEVINKLEKWYGVKFILQDGYMFKGDYTGVFEKESLENVLKGIGYASAFAYEINDKTVFISHH
ncbi:FecR domain-containing protein [Fulvivirgaceae bacterium BMA10]|uniref:FecR domain-containing protein n=1 Tax=Splendidivirga corallicola TaxID=3051826 RepID=A0ABT8KN23_9BACT|nr:FecR domain-containing protein [Fulvivirgaceae bacterium BMA10]